MKRYVCKEQIHAAMQTIIDNADNKALNYAVNYAKVGMFMTGDELRAQCLYVLNNMTHWYGDVAKEVRSVLKGYW